MNRSADQLAVLGGSPAFPDILHVGRPNLPDRQRFFELVSEAFDRCWLTNDGTLVRRLEATLAERLGVRECVAMVNATAALELLLHALGVRGEVILPAFTFIATAHAVARQGLTPVFADVDPRTHTLSPEHAQRLLGPLTGAILGVHLWGNACDTEALAALASERGVPVIYDAAHAFDCSHLGRPIGGFGSAEVLSFHATKFINCFEGGAVTTNDPALAGTLRLLRNFGFAGFDDVRCWGTNAKMHEASAAMGLASLENVEELVATNARNFAAYERELSSLDGLRLVVDEREGRRNRQYVIVDVATEAPLTRDTLCEVLWAEGVRARRYFYPGCHRSEPYATLCPQVDLPSTDRLAKSCLALPTGASISLEAIARIAAILATALDHPHEVEAALARNRDGLGVGR